MLTVHSPRGRTPTLVNYDDADVGGYGSSDDDSDRSYFSPSGVRFAAYGGVALAAAADEPEDDKPSGRSDDDDDDDDSGLPKPFTSSLPSSSRSLVPSHRGRSGDSHHGGDRDDGALHVGTSWSQTGDVWWTSASGDHHEIAFGDSPACHE